MSEKPERPNPKPKSAKEEEVEEEEEESPEEKEIEHTDEDEEVFTMFGIQGKEQKEHAKILAASRVIAHRRLNPKPPKETPEKPLRWTPLGVPKKKG